jgi:pantoate--beta-alanine ligase
MLIFNKINKTKNYIKALRAKNHQIGFVPTMGALHNGHLSLIKNSLNENDNTIVSIFINPTQFENKQDFMKYPYEIESDIKKLEEISKKIILFSPSNHEIYQDKIISENFNFNNLDKFMEGKYRKGHFEGVATIVNKLLNAIEPTKIYFGEKDFQQLRIIENLIKKRHPQINLIRCETIRHKNGLAFSSRNKKLNNSSLKIATNLYKALNFVKQNIHTVDLKNIKKQALKYLSQFPEIKIEYLEIADEETLTTVENCVNGKKYRVFIAAYIFEVRLIDNIKLY